MHTSSLLTWFRHSVCRLFTNLGHCALESSVLTVLGCFDVEIAGGGEIISMYAKFCGSAKKPRGRRLESHKQKRKRRVKGHGLLECFLARSHAITEYQATATMLFQKL